jgi:hypothetical protein
MCRTTRMNRRGQKGPTGEEMSSVLVAAGDKEVTRLDKCVDSPHVSDVDGLARQLPNPERRVERLIVWQCSGLLT